MCSDVKQLFRNAPPLFRKLTSLKRDSEIRRFHTGDVYNLDPSKSILPDAPLVLAGVIPSFRERYNSAAVNALHFVCRRALTEAAEAGCTKLTFWSFGNAVADVCEGSARNARDSVAHVMLRTIRHFIDQGFGASLTEIVIASFQPEGPSAPDTRRLYFPETAADQEAARSVLPALGAPDEHGAVQHTGREIRVSSLPGTGSSGGVSSIRNVRVGGYDDDIPSSNDDADDADDDDEYNEDGEEGAGGRGRRASTGSVKASIVQTKAEDTNGRDPHTIYEVNVKLLDPASSSSSSTSTSTSSSSPSADSAAGSASAVDRPRSATAPTDTRSASTEAKELTARRRYSQFHALRERIMAPSFSPKRTGRTAKVISKVAFPSKKLFGSMKPSTVARRAKKLQNFLDGKRV